MDAIATFRKRISEPLESVVGRALLAVSYWILDSGRADFSAQQPNVSGVSAVSLHFEAASVEIAPGWEKSLRPNGVYHHVQVFDTGKPGAAESGPVRPKFLSEVVATRSAPWREAIGKPLVGVQVLGLKESPQAIRLSFPDSDVVVVAGYPGPDPGAGDDEQLLIGDGDELLIFSERDWDRWRESASIHEQIWERLWTSSAAPHRDLLAK